MNQEQLNIINSSLSKSEKIRRLSSSGLSNGKIAAVLSIRYQHVYNVLRSASSDTNELITFTNSNSNRIGIEIEFMGADRYLVAQKLTEAGIRSTAEAYNHTTRSYWKVITDATCGSELVSPPLEINEAIRQLQIVCKVLKECGAKVNSRCGLHIHFEASRHSFETWKNVAINYQRLEDGFDSMMPASRENNRYARSICYNRYDLATNFNELGRNSRYYKINFQSYVKHGTVEFRHHSGTLNFKKISNWISILSDLIEYSSRGVVELGGSLREVLSDRSAQYYNQRAA